METNKCVALAANRYLDPVGIGVCNTQELHLHSSAVDGGVDTEGCPSTEGLGVGYRKEKAQGDERYQELNYVASMELHRMYRYVK